MFPLMYFKSALICNFLCPFNIKTLLNFCHARTQHLEYPKSVFLCSSHSCRMNCLLFIFKWKPFFFLFVLTITTLMMTNINNRLLRSVLIELVMSIENMSMDMLFKTEKLVLLLSFEKSIEPFFFSIGAKIVCIKSLVGKYVILP